MTPIAPRKNSEASKTLTLKEIAALVGGELLGGDESARVTGVAGIKEAEEGDISFLANDKYLPFLQESKAAVVLVPLSVECPNKPLIRVQNPSKAFTKIAVHFSPAPVHFFQGIHPTATVEASAQIGSRVSVGPHVYIGEGSSIGSGSSLGAGVFIGPGCVIGENVLIYPNATLREYTQVGDRCIIHSGAVIGSDGYGYETHEGEHEKIPHTGFVLIEEDVEIGANACIDRGRFKKTWIQKGTKIDNLVQVAHNVVIGPNSLIVSQAGISGSTEIGKNVIIAGQAGIVGHITVGDSAIIGAGAGVTKPVPAHAVVLGSPAKPIQEQKKLFAYISRLPDLFKEIAEIRKKLDGSKGPAGPA